MKFPEFPATFPALDSKSADYGQNLQDCAAAFSKFAAKFPEAGNSKQASARVRSPVTSPDHRFFLPVT